jgi:hypothetical protein
METEEFIMGMGRYIARTQGKRMALSMFDSDHFDALSQWKWDTEKLSFITPIKKLAYANLRYDNNLPAIKALHLMDLQRKKEEKAEADKAKQMLQRITAPNNAVPAMLNVIPTDNKNQSQQQNIARSRNVNNSERRNAGNKKRGGDKDTIKNTDGNVERGGNQNRGNSNTETDIDEQ